MRYIQKIIDRENSELIQLLFSPEVQTEVLAPTHRYDAHLILTDVHGALCVEDIQGELDTSQCKSVTELIISDKGLYLSITGDTEMTYQIYDNYFSKNSDEMLLSKAHLFSRTLSSNSLCEIKDLVYIPELPNRIETAAFDVMSNSSAEFFAISDGKHSIARFGGDDVYETSHSEASFVAVVKVYPPSRWKRQIASTLSVTVYGNSTNFADYITKS